MLNLTAGSATSQFRAELEFSYRELLSGTRRPEPGERVVMVIAAGFAETPVDSFTALAPQRTTFAALGPAFVDSLAARGTRLTDNYAPIDRLVGARD